jgi:type I restriction enzyme S subunit
MIQDHFDVETWERVAFGEVVQNKNENTSNPSLEGLSRVVGLDHMDSESLPLVRWSELDDLPDGTTFTRRFHAGQVLFGKRRSYQKKVSFPDFDGVCSGDILVFQSLDSKRLLPGFLPLLVQSDPFMEFAISTSAGSLSPRTKWSDLSKFEFLLPSLKNQEEIVEIIRSIDKAIQGYKKLSVRSYRESIVHELLSTGADNWTRTTLGEIAQFFNGRTFKQEELLTDGKHRVLRVGNFFSNGKWYWSNLDLDENKYCDQGDLLYAWSASFGPQIWSEEKVVYHYHIWKVVEDALHVNKMFLYYWLEDDVQRMKKDAGTGSTIMHITKGEIESRAILLPPLDEQMQIVKIVSSIDAMVDATEQSMSSLKLLRKSILEEVFKEHGRV